MADRKNNKDYVDNIFIRRTWRSEEDLDNELFSVGINVEKFIAELRKLKTNEKGFANLSMGSRKDDSSKMSLWIDKNESRNSSPKSSTPAPPPSSSPKTTDPEVDDLPF